MRKIILLVGAAILVGASSPAAPPRTAGAQAKLDKHLDGRVAGQPVRCVKSDLTTSPIAIDDRTILFKDGPRIWRNDLKGGINCGDLGARKSLMTTDRSVRVCNGDTMHIVDLSDGEGVGGCVLGDFVPYMRP